MAHKFIQECLEILSKTLPETHSALFVTQDNQGPPIVPLAKWPEYLNQYDDFAQIIKYAMDITDPVSIRNVLQSDQTYYDYFALPLTVPSGVSGMLVFKLIHSPEERQESIINSLGQALPWLNLAKSKPDPQADVYVPIVKLLASCFEQKSYREILIVLVTELTRSFHCERVVLGEYHARHSKVVALSNSAQFDGRSNFMQKTADAMDEAIEQDSLILFPNTQTICITRAHQEVSRKFGSGVLLTIPLINNGDVFGAITFFRSEDRPFDLALTQRLKQATLLITPYLALKKRDEQALITTFLQRFQQRCVGIFGFTHLKTKLAAISLAVIVVLAGLLNGDFQVTADAVLEGKMQRVIAAPIEGYLVSASVKAGDTVHKGELMASLDDADLQLEFSKLNGQLQKYRREYREALSSSDLVKVRIISAEIDQATAEMELTQKQLQKIALTAPFDSVVIEGDLSQMLGSPVERGDTLFKIAPLEGYRIVLKIDERLISYVQEGQKGLLVLSSMPDHKFMLTVQKITAVAKTDNQENIFRVEASLDHAPELLRPGMEGIGKIDVCRKRLLWIWTHELTEWLRLWFWSWSF